jgi:hypothetical protein
MPLIDVYSESGTFADHRSLAKELAASVMWCETVRELTLRHATAIRSRQDGSGAKLLCRCRRG